MDQLWEINTQSRASLGNGFLGLTGRLLNRNMGVKQREIVFDKAVKLRIDRRPFDMRFLLIHRVSQR